MFNLMIDKDSRIFWEGAKNNKLMVQKSKSTGNYFLYSLGHSKVNANEEYDWIQASGKGSIYSYTVSYIPGGSKYYIDKTPYIIGSILLDEGVRLTSNIILSNPREVKIGKKVAVVFKKLDELITFPCFKLI